MKTLISFLIFIISTLCCYSHTSMMGAQQTVAAQRASFNDIISIGELIKVDTTQCLEDRLADIAFGKRICQPLLYLYCAGYGDAGRYGGFFLPTKSSEKLAYNSEILSNFVVK